MMKTIRVFSKKLGTTVNYTVCNNGSASLIASPESKGLCPVEEWRGDAGRWEDGGWNHSSGWQNEGWNNSGLVGAGVSASQWMDKGWANGVGNWRDGGWNHTDTWVDKGWNNS